MARQFFRGRPFRNTHENKAFDRFCHAVEFYTQSTDELRVTGNVEYDSGQIDALVLKSHAITIVDFKDWGGVITVGPNLPWVRQDGRKVKGGSYATPSCKSVPIVPNWLRIWRPPSGRAMTIRTSPDLSCFCRIWSLKRTPMIPLAERPVIGSALVTGTVAYSTFATCHPQSWTSRSPSSTKLVSLLGVNSYVLQPEGRLVPASDL
ncbi:nuclease-related domain-containing protein [Sinorhizobium meliloti]|uniref:nuclease-related domain-containing protein n=1 Tax=Rhizobium meliloti TaxID=382 RepID=UPI000FDC81BE|nr:NERD domain-containing protein [Sinorhizobium meliloti]